jgi:hypothetical protein
MTIDEVTAKIKAAPKGKALKVAQAAIKELSEFDFRMAGGDLESSALLMDQEVAGTIRPRLRS